MICGYCCLGFVEFMFKSESLTNFTNIFSPNNFKGNNKMTLNCFLNWYYYESLNHLLIKLYVSTTRKCTLYYFVLLKIMKKTQWIKHSVNLLQRLIMLTRLYLFCQQQVVVFILLWLLLLSFEALVYFCFFINGISKNFPQIKSTKKRNKIKLFY